MSNYTRAFVLVAAMSAAACSGTQQAANRQPAEAPTTPAPAIKDLVAATPQPAEQSVPVINEITAFTIESITPCEEEPCVDDKEKIYSRPEQKAIQVTVYGTESNDGFNGNSVISVEVERTCADFLSKSPDDFVRESAAALNIFPVLGTRPTQFGSLSFKTATAKTVAIESAVKAQKECRAQVAEPYKAFFDIK